MQFEILKATSNKKVTWNQSTMLSSLYFNSKLDISEEDMSDFDEMTRKSKVKQKEMPK